MARSSTDSVVADTRVHDLMEQITCHLCHALYLEARALPCLHYYCKRCVRENIVNSTIHCPKCNQSHKLDQDQVEQLSSVRQTSEIEAFKSALSKTLNKDELSDCELCTDPVPSSVSAYCYNCCKFLCSFCQQVHARLKQFARHTVLTLSEMATQPQDFQYMSTKKTRRRTSCSTHNMDLKSYCYDCDRLICRECKLAQHKHHNCQSIHETSEEVKLRLKKSRESLHKLVALIDETRKKFGNDIENMEKEALEAGDFINRSFDIVLRLFEKYRSNLLNSLENKLKAEVRELACKEILLAAAQKKLTSLARLIEQEVAHGSREDLVTMHKQMLQQVLEKEDFCREKLEPPGEIATGLFVVYMTSSAHIIGAIGDSLKRADPIMCSLKGTGAKSAEINKEIMFMLEVNQSNDTPCQALQNVQVDLCSENKHTKCEITVRAIKGSMYEVSYTPKVQGKHTLNVTVNERTISGNPFHIIVKKPILERNKPVLIIEGVKKLGDIAIHRDGNLIGTQYQEGAVVSIDKKGAHMRTLLSGLAQPFGIATDKYGAIFVSLTRKCCVQKYMNAKLMASIGCKQMTLGHFNRPGRLALSAIGELFVCDTRNSRIQAFDEDLEYLRWYSVSKPAGVAVDARGEIFVSESGRNTLSKICDVTKLGIARLNQELSDPQGVYVDNDYVYVAERGKKQQLSVFTHEGTFVKALGVGVLREPGGVVGDKDGYLYVCDEQLEAICVF